ncbi:hypothetical protein M408DRAFT_290678 [Serendipita vermifera MAFF 305830]|uniref:Uncharacterized protein n=1 Tax=Serendipita vermifera MAFF 305830 TaxID=933852 RepID=A0A0C2W7D2_SERVB|nr:hypothetical protein M408DRAFT_290678 [Serendipita vermifera MAFF 305830]
MHSAVQYNWNFDTIRWRGFEVFRSLVGAILSPRPLPWRLPRKWYYQPITSRQRLFLSTVHRRYTNRRLFVCTTSQKPTASACRLDRYIVKPLGLTHKDLLLKFRVHV